MYVTQCKSRNKLTARAGVILCTDWRPSNRLVVASIAFLWILVFLMEIIPPFTVNNHGPFYDGVGFWCFSSNDYQWIRLANHYVFIFLSAFGSALIYAFTSWHIYGHYRRAAALGLANDKVQLRSASRMLLFPLAYWVVVMPLAGYRLAQMAGAKPDKSALAFAGIAFASSGTLNIVLYSATRNVLQFSFLRSSRGRLTTAFGKQSHLTNQVSVQIQTAVHQDTWQEDEKDKRPGSFELGNLAAPEQPPAKFAVRYATRMVREESANSLAM
jgi:hypothetical protein